MSTRHPDIAYAAPVLCVAELDRALAYYCGTLGFVREFVHADFYAGIARDGCRVHLRCAPDVARRRPVADTDHVDVCFGVRDACTLAAHFERQGAAFAVPLREMPYGREFYLRDPDGNVLAFVEAAIA